MSTAPTVQQQQIEYLTGFAPQIAPYAERLLGAAESTLFDYVRKPTGEIDLDETGMPKIKGFKPYMQYQGDRFAQFTPLQQQAFAGAQAMEAAPQLRDASSMLGLAGLRALGYGYKPGQFTNQFVAPQQFQPSQFTAPGVSSRDLTTYQMSPAERVAAREQTAPQMTTAQSRFAPNLQAFQMGPAERVSTESFARPGSAAAYMSPYMQSVVDIQQREAQRQADIAGTARGQKYARAGAFGGARQAIENAEAARNLAMQKGDIQAQGLQSAYQQAQQQFNAEQAARIQAQLANQQAGLTTGQQNLAAQLGVQQLGTQTGLQTALANLSAEQQANVQNQAAQLQTQGMNAQQALQAALANQQAGLTVGQQNLASQLGTQQLGAQQGLQAQLANQQAQMQAQQLAEQSKQFGYGQQLQAAGMGAQYGQAAQQLGEQSAQFGAGLGLQGLQAAMQAGQGLGNIGQTQFGQNMAINQLQNQYGQQQQQQMQNILGAQYQDFLNAQNYPFRQMGFVSDVVRGVPLTQTGTSVYGQAPSTVSQIAGLGTAALGASRLFGGFARGGKVEDVAYREKPAGLADLAIYNMGR
jgi:hypothetical protein